MVHCTTNVHKCKQKHNGRIFLERRFENECSPDGDNDGPGVFDVAGAMTSENGISVEK